ncbi:MAG: esterase [Candidatus Riflebacteria bacterium]|nr:esterase [Candidatus Riflebacteria bacterium]
MSYHLYLFVMLLLLSIHHQAPAAETVKIHLKVFVPEDTDTEKKVFLCGNLDILGNWKSNGLMLQKDSGKFWHTEIEIPKGKLFLYKFTLGDWKLVEKCQKGLEIPNRTLRAEKAINVECTVQKWGTNIVKSTLTGNIKFHEEFTSKYLKNKRTIAVYLPPQYEKSTGERFPVLYMHDGQNIFDAATCFSGSEWQADETAEKLIAEKEIEPLIIVGIYNNADRADEYLPVRDEIRKKGGNASAYARFVTEEVKPFIDKNYRTLPERENTAIAGSSFGGVISMYIASIYPEIFSKCAIVSPGLWIGDKWPIRQAKEDGKWMQKMRLWLDMGTQEGDDITEFNKGISDTRELEKLFISNGLKSGKDYIYLEVEGGRHHESDWAKRFDRILKFFFGIKNN